eukprot:TRINITY_DN81993_c0_g1_i1.p1 TRINITY_DN81993_c0_g1~~TRINITY_DN81993_c0_g1_i1.p1  ORF type:complete len:179 (+),score=40.85 TRINITY_DN81993_c0_g1_i1:80-538(+)
MALAAWSAALRLLLCIVATSAINVRRGSEAFADARQGPVTEEERLDHARAVIQDVLRRQEARQASDTSKAEFCKEHAEDLEKDIDEAHGDLASKLATYERLQAMEAECGCCCDNYNDIQMKLVYARKDVEYAQDRVPNLEKQAKHLDSWCSV